MPTSSWTAIVARVKAQIETIANVGLVHDRLRLAKTRDEIYALGKVTIGGEAKLRMWMISLESMDSERADSAGRVQWNRQVIIEGFLSFEDEGAANTAAALAESIARVLDADVWATRLGDTILLGKTTAITANEPRLFGPVVFHYIRLVLLVHTLEG